MGDGRGVEWERKRRWGQEGKREWVEGMLASATRQSLTNAPRSQARAYSCPPVLLRTVQDCGATCAMRSYDARVVLP